MSGEVKGMDRRPSDAALAKAGELLFMEMERLALEDEKKAREISLNGDQSDGQG